MGHLRVAVCLGFEMSLNYCKGNEFDLHKNTQPLPFEWLCTRTRFEAEACSNSEMGYLTIIP